MAKAAFGTVSTSREHRPLPARRHSRRAREKRVKRDFIPLGPALEQRTQLVASTPDPVQIAVLAMEGLGRASIRASFTGTEVQVAVPDARTAAVFEAALIETAHRRPTDRLIRIVIG